MGGEKITESVLPGLAPVQPGGPKLLVGTIGPKTVRSAATWADGLAGISMDLDTAKENARSMSRANPGPRQATRTAPGDVVLVRPR
jgi:alkanesulfonate monooxygenase SsuD/methylene tetrahydromethanopterin reductase-like flavin-dependent oxidoreductase (luciferase family)